MRGWIIGRSRCSASQLAGHIGQHSRCAVVRDDELYQERARVTTVPTVLCVQATDNTWNCLVNYNVISTTGSALGQQAIRLAQRDLRLRTGTCEYPAFTQTPVNP